MGLLFTQQLDLLTMHFFVIKSKMTMKNGKIDCF